MADNHQVMLHPIDALPLRLPRDPVVESAWRVFLSLLIFAAASVGVMLAYFAFFAFLASAWRDGAACLGIAIALGGAVTWLCYNRNDLAGSV